MDKIDPIPGVIEIGWELDGMDNTELASKVQNTDITPPVEQTPPPETVQEESQTITDDLSDISLNEDDKIAKKKDTPSVEKPEEKQPTKEVKPEVSSWLKNLPSGWWHAKNRRSKFGSRSLFLTWSGCWIRWSSKWSIRCRWNRRSMGN